MRATPRARASTPSGTAGLRMAFVVSLAVALCAVVAWQLIVPGPFDWAVTRPETWQGGLEAAALLAALAFAQCVAAPRARLIVSAVIAALFLRRHAVDAPLLVCVFYLELTLALGAAVARIARTPAPQHSEDYLRCFALGLSAWSVLAWTSAAAGWGTPEALRVLTLLMLPFAFWSRSRPLCVHLVQRSLAWPRRERMLLALLGGWLLVLFARTNTAFSFDGLWYGLRPEYVLTADGSPFAPLGLVSPVHYFPKLYEIYLLPVSGLGDASVVSGMTVLLLGLLALAGVRLLARLGVETNMARLSLALLVVTLPAIANPALEPKPDIVCALFLVLAALYGGDALRQRDASALAWTLGTALLALSSKLIAVPYLGMLAIGAAVACWRLPASPATSPSTSTRLAVTAFALALTTAAFVATRTWLLTGMPTIGPDPLFKIWTLLGFQLHEPAGTLTWALPQQWGEVPALVVDWLLRPQRMDHIAISWTGNVWLWLPITALLLRARQLPADATVRTHRLLAVSLIAAGIIIAVGWAHHTRGSDGNYFIAALVPALALGIAFAWRELHHRPDAHRPLLAGVALFAMFQAAYAFVSASWAPGTRPLDLVFDRSPRDARKLAAGILEHAGLADIGDYLRRQPGVARVVGCAPFEAAARLPARFEDFSMIAQSRPEYVASLDAAVTYMRRFAIPYVLLPKPRAGSDPATQLIDGCTPRTEAPPGTRVVYENARFLLARLVGSDSS